jgi:protein-tyrosine phosphatase
MRRVENLPLWLGHVGDFSDLRAIFALGILAVVDLALNETPGTLNRELVYARIPIVDSSGNPRWLLRAAIETVAAFVRARTPTLVFCSAGMSRSPCIAAAALALVTGCSTGDALQLVIRSGPVDISPALWSEVEPIVRQLQTEQMDDWHGKATVL